MRIQLFAKPHDWTIVGEAEIQKDQFARYYLDGTRVALVRPEGVFTTLRCANGQNRVVMTSDWAEVERLGGAPRRI